MRYAGLIKDDFGNGYGVGCTLFVQGCNRHCKNCFNPETWDFNGGKEFTPVIKHDLLEALQRPYISRFTLLGGEPLSDKNVSDCTALLTEILATRPNLKVWIYTGYTFEEVIDNRERFECASKADVLIDGAYIDSKRDLTLKFRGSTNQRIIDVKYYLKTGDIKEIE